jgi:uncharacterized membrane protein
MSLIEHGIEVEVPLRTAYNQWTQFEEFPRFMEGVEEVKQLDDSSLRWKAEFLGEAREWDAKISEQRPDERIAWTTVDGPYNSGVVTFHRLDDNRCRVMLQMDFAPEGFKEKAADMLGIVRSRVKSDLENFKRFIEERGAETGQWRGEVDRPDQH